MNIIQFVMQKKGWYLENTGGNCTAWKKDFIDRSGYFLITKQTDPSAPKRLTDKILVGRYEDDELVDEYLFDSLAEYVRSSIIQRNC